jgi:HSP20 family protein
MTSFFSRFTQPSHDEEVFDEEGYEQELDVQDDEASTVFEEDGELSLDVYENKNNIIVKAFTPGVKKEDLEITLSRDSLSIRGVRIAPANVDKDDYFRQELFWGSFSRSITLPEEVDIDDAEAHEDHGLLTITLPKTDKGRQQKVKIKDAK